MDSRDAKKKRKVAVSKLTKLSLKKTTQESKTAEDSFDGFGSFALSLRSSKEIDGTTSSSGEEKSNFFNRKTVELLPLRDEVRDSSQLQTQPSHHNLLLESSPHRKTSHELLGVKHFKDSIGDSDQSFAENFETSSKEKQCSYKSWSHEEIRTQKVGVNDVPLVSKVENDNIICLHSSQCVSQNGLNNNTLIRKSNNCYIETDRNLPLLPSVNKFAVDCETTKCGRDCVNDIVSGVTPNSVLKQKSDEDLLVNGSKQKQESVFVLKSEVTSSSAEDIDVCVLQDNISRDARNVHDADDDQLSPYFSTSDLTCPLCWKKFDKKSVQTSHMKSCAVSHNVTTKQLLDALALQSKQAAERKALGLPEAPVIAAQVSTRKNVSRKVTGVPKDQNLQLALALSVSMKEAEQLELEKEEDALIEAGLGEEVMERQKNLLEKFGFTSSKPPSLDPASLRGGPKKVKCSVPVLMTRSREERERLITEKVAIILMGKEDEAETCQMSEKSSNSECRQQTISSKYLHKFLNEESYLWKKSQVPPEGIHRNSYYVSYLDTFITPSTVVTGSQLKDISKIPCREKTPMRDSLMKADTNEEDYCQQSGLTHVKYVPEGPCDSLDKQEESHSSYDGNEKKDFSSVSSSSLSSHTASFFSFGKDYVLQNWKMQINSKTMSDVTIHVKNSLEISAHRLVFFAQAPSILCDISETAGEQVGHLYWKDVSFNSALAFLHYIYCGNIEEICSLQESVNDIRSLAVRYNMSELSDHLDNFHNMNSSSLKHSHNQCLNSRIEEKYNSNKFKRTSRMFDKFQSHSEPYVEDSVDTPQQRNERHCRETDKCEDSAASSACDGECTEYICYPQRSEEILRKSQINENDDKSDRSSPDIFSEPHTPTETNDIQRDNIDILSSMLCRLTSDHEPTNIDNSIRGVHEDTNSVSDLTQGSPQEFNPSNCGPPKVVEVENDLLTNMHEDGNIHCNMTPETPEKYCSVNFAGALTATPTSAKRKLTDLILTPSKCNSPAKKICKERDSTHLELESINKDQASSIPSDSFIDTIDLTQNSDGSHENEANLRNYVEDSSTEGTNQPDDEAVEINDTSNQTFPLMASGIHSFEIAKSDTEIQDNFNNCSQEPNQVNDAYFFDNSTAVPENNENASLMNSPLESCRTEESPEYGITTFTSPESALKPIDQMTEETCTNSPLSETPLALRCLSQFSDATMRRSLSQMMSHLVDQDTQSLISAHDKVGCKQISAGVTNIHSSGTPKSLKQTAMNSLRMMLEDSFVDQIRDSSFFRQEFINSPSESCRTETNDNINNENSGNSEYHLVTPGSKSSISEELTPLPDYSTMKTPQLKKELQRYGLKPLKRKQAKLILRHIYNELHPWVPGNDTVTTQAVSSPITSLVLESRKGRENTSKQIKNSDPLVPTTRSPRKRNILKGFSDSSKACSSSHKGDSDDECDSEMFFESNHNAKDYSILVDDEEVFHEQNATCENGSECSQGVDMQTAVQNFIINNPEIHEKILMYEPVWLNDLKNGLKVNKVKFKLNDLMDYLDEQCITYRTAVGPQKTRQKRKGVTTSQSQNVSRKKRTTEEDYDPLPSSVY